MSLQILVEASGTWEEISELASKHVGHKMHLTVYTDTVAPAAAPVDPTTLEAKVVKILDTAPEPEAK